MNSEPENPTCKGSLGIAWSMRGREEKEREIKENSLEFKEEGK